MWCRRGEVAVLLSAALSACGGEAPTIVSPDAAVTVEALRLVDVSVSPARAKAGDRVVVQVISSRAPEALDVQLADRALACVALRPEVHRCEAVLRGREVDGEGVAAIVVRAESVVRTASIALDFRPPGLVAPRLVSTARVRDGQRIELQFGVSESLAAVPTARAEGRQTLPLGVTRRRSDLYVASATLSGLEPQDEVYTLSVTLEDVVGNVVTTTVGEPVLVDTQPPSLGEAWIEEARAPAEACRSVWTVAGVPGAVERGARLELYGEPTASAGERISTATIARDRSFRAALPGARSVVYARLADTTGNVAIVPVRAVRARRVGGCLDVRAWGQASPMTALDVRDASSVQIRGAIDVVPEPVREAGPLAAAAFDELRGEVLGVRPSGQLQRWRQGTWTSTSVERAPLGWPPLLGRSSWQYDTARDATWVLDHGARALWVLSSQGVRPVPLPLVPPEDRGASAVAAYDTFVLTRDERLGELTLFTTYDDHLLDRWSLDGHAWRQHPRVAAPWGAAMTGACVDASTGAPRVSTADLLLTVGAAGQWQVEHQFGFTCWAVTLVCPRTLPAVALCRGLAGVEMARLEGGAWRTDAVPFVPISAWYDPVDDTLHAASREALWRFDGAVWREVQRHVSPTTVTALAVDPRTRELRAPELVWQSSWRAELGAIGPTLWRASAYDPRRDELLVYAGGQEWARARSGGWASRAVPLRDPRVAFDDTRGDLVAVSVPGEASAAPELWRRDAGWTRTGTAPRVWALSADPRAGGVVALGPLGGGAASWVLRDRTWTQTSTSALPDVQGALMAWDHDGQRVLVVSERGTGVLEAGRVRTLVPTWRTPRVDFSTSELVGAVGAGGVYLLDARLRVWRWAADRWSLVSEGTLDTVATDRSGGILGVGLEGARDFDGARWTGAERGYVRAELVYDEAAARWVGLTPQEGTEPRRVVELDAGVWTERSELAPPASACLGISYDPGRAELVLHDACGGGRTWVASGQGWILRDDIPSSTRASWWLPDRAGGRLLRVFDDGEVWAWTGFRWTSVAPGLGSRALPLTSAAVDERTGEVVGLSGVEVHVLRGMVWSTWPRRAVATDERAVSLPGGWGVLSRAAQSLAPVAPASEAWAGLIVRSSPTDERVFSGVSVRLTASAQAYDAAGQLDPELEVYGMDFAAGRWVRWGSWPAPTLVSAEVAAPIVSDTRWRGADGTVWILIRTRGGRAQDAPAVLAVDTVELWSRE